MQKVKKIGEFKKQVIDCDFGVFQDLENDNVFIEEKNTKQKITLKYADVSENSIKFVNRETITGTGRKADGFFVDADIAEKIKNTFDEIQEKEERKEKERKKRYFEKNKLDDIYFIFDEKAKTSWADMQINYAGWVLKNKVLTEKQEKKLDDFYKKYSDKLYITRDYIDEKFINKKNNNKTLTIDEIEKELLKNKDIQEKIKKVEEKNKYEDKDGKVFYGGKEIGTYTDETGFDNSFGENTEDDSDWIPGHRSYQIKKEYIEKFKKDTKHIFVDELK
jgi:hypothetical protein